MEPICNDSNAGLGYALVDDHNEAHPIDDEAIEARRFEAQFYEPSKESLKRTDVRRELKVHGAGDYSIQTIPPMIPSIDEHVLYKGVMFMSKNELKQL